MNNKITILLVILVVCSAIVIASCYAASSEHAAVSHHNNNSIHGHFTKKFDPNNFVMHPHGVLSMYLDRIDDFIN